MGNNMNVFKNKFRKYKIKAENSPNTHLKTCFLNLGGFFLLIYKNLTFVLDCLK